MKVQATDRKLKVAYRLAGKYYGQNGLGEGSEQFDNGTHTSYPFDEVDVEVGTEWILPTGATLVFVKEYLPTPDFTVSYESA
jgi:hypothetical protein